MTAATPFDGIQTATRRHRQRHGCDAYTFEDGAGLTALARTYRPERVLEIGTALGFTACCLATANSNVMVDTVEIDPEHVMLARDNIRSVGLQDRIHVHAGDFTTLASAFDPGFDIVFFDGAIPDPAILASIRMLLRDEGILICANLVWASGQAERALDDELSSPCWTRVGQIEGGRTHVFRKQGGDQGSARAASQHA